MRLPSTKDSALAASIMESFHREHNDDDTHKTITASGLIYERKRTKAIGETIVEPFRPGDFTGFGTMTWTVTQAAFITFDWNLVGDRMLLSFDLRNTTVVAVLTAALQMKIPGGYYAKRADANLCRILDNAVQATGYVQSTMDSNLLLIQRMDGANFAAAAANTSVKGQLNFKVGTA